MWFKKEAEMEGYGDRLARGANSAVFGPGDNKISQAKWDAAFEGFDVEDFKKNGFRPEGKYKKALRHPQADPEAAA